MTKASTRAYPDSIGVDLAIVGVSLTSQTGYSSATSIDFAMGTLGHPWCGYADHPGGAPQLMTIHNSVI